MSKRVRLFVSFDLPLEASVDDAMNYVADAVTSWRGSLNPEEDCMFDLNPDSVVVLDLRKAGEKFVQQLANETSRGKPGHHRRPIKKGEQT